MISKTENHSINVNGKSLPTENLHDNTNNQDMESIPDLKDLTLEPSKKSTESHGSGEDIKNTLKNDLNIIESAEEDYQDSNSWDDGLDCLAYSLKEKQKLENDLKIRKLQEKEQVWKLADKLSDLNSNRSARIQEYSQNIESEELKNKMAKHMEFQNVLALSSEQLSEINQRVSIEKERQDKLLMEIQNGQIHNHNLENENARLQAMIKEIQGKNESLETVLNKQKQDFEKKKQENYETDLNTQEEEIEEEDNDTFEASVVAKPQPKTKSIDSATPKPKQEPEKKTADSFTSTKTVEEEFLKNKKLVEDTLHKTEELQSVLDSQNDISTMLGSLNFRLTQLTKSKKNILEVFEALSKTFKDIQRINSEYYLFFLSYFSEALISEAEKKVSVSFELSYPLGLVSCYLLCEFPELKDVLIPKIIDACPLLIGYVVPIDTAEGRKTMKLKDNESAEQYNERMIAITATWTAITISEPLNKNDIHPYPIDNSWKFIARVLNTPVNLLTNTHFALICGWWDIASKTFENAFGKQGTKVLQALCVQLPALVKNKNFSFAKKLELIGEDFKKDKNKALKPVPTLSE